MGGKALRPKSSKQGYVITIYFNFYTIIHVNNREITQEAKTDTPSNTNNINLIQDRVIKTLSVITVLLNSQDQISKEIIIIIAI